MFNRIILIGNLTDNSAVRGQNTKVTKFRLACTTKVKDKENTLFIDVVVPGKELNLQKGERVLVEGLLQNKTSTDGKKNSEYEVAAFRCLSLSSRKSGQKPSQNVTAQRADMEDEPF
jgi:single-stranded DNA-binding protein